MALRCGMEVALQQQYQQRQVFQQRIHKTVLVFHIKREEWVAIGPRLKSYALVVEGPGDLIYKLDLPLGFGLVTDYGAPATWLLPDSTEHWGVSYRHMHRAFTISVYRFSGNQQGTTFLLKPIV